jgi:1,4-dihydroxy-2-naphthoate octaprenyltransferase
MADAPHAKTTATDPTRTIAPMQGTQRDADVGIAPSVRPGSWQAWAVASRPRSLWIAVSPVLVGAVLGFARTGPVDPLSAIFVLAAALLMQLLTNLQNDVGFTVRGGDARGTRSGLPRATAQGWLSVRQVRAAIAMVALVALGVGLALVARRGWPVLAIGSASMLAALAYMGGPKPIAYTPFGELTVFVFFGLVAVTGTDWVLTGSVGQGSVFAAVAMGGLAATVLAINNHRDIAHDRLVGRRTFAATFGERASRRLFDALLFAPFIVMAFAALLGQSPALLAPLLLLPTAWRLRQDFDRCSGGVAYNAVLFRSFRLIGWFAVLLAGGVLLGRAWH